VQKTNVAFFNIDNGAYRKLELRDLYQFLWMLPMAVAWFSSGVVSVRYILPVLWICWITVWSSLRRTDFA